MKLVIPSSLLILILSLYADCSVAVLPPYYEDIKEIKAILDDPKITEKAGSRPIQSIAKVSINDKKGWKLLLGPQGQCSLVVNIDYKFTHEPGFVGPQEFELNPEDLVCQQPTNTTINQQTPSTMLPKLPDSD